MVFVSIQLYIIANQLLSARQYSDIFHWETNFSDQDFEITWNKYKTIKDMFMAEILQFLQTL